MIIVRPLMAGTPVFSRAMAAGSFSAGAFSTTKVTGFSATAGTPTANVSNNDLNVDTHIGEQIILVGLPTITGNPTVHIYVNGSSAGSAAGYATLFRTATLNDKISLYIQNGAFSTLTGTEAFVAYAPLTHPNTMAANNTTSQAPPQSSWTNKTGTWTTTGAGEIAGSVVDSSGGFVVQESGKIIILGGLASADNCAIRFIKNGTDVLATSGYGTNMAVRSQPIEVSSGDVINLQVSKNTSLSRSVTQAVMHMIPVPS